MLRLWQYGSRQKMDGWHDGDIPDRFVERVVEFYQQKFEIDEVDFEVIDTEVHGSTSDDFCVEVSLDDGTVLDSDCEEYVSLDDDIWHVME